jgi:hypothetical protein
MYLFVYVIFSIYWSLIVQYYAAVTSWNPSTGLTLDNGLALKMPDYSSLLLECFISLLQIEITKFLHGNYKRYSAKTAALETLQGEPCTYQQKWPSPTSADPSPPSRCSRENTPDLSITDHLWPPFKLHGRYFQLHADAARPHVVSAGQLNKSSLPPLWRQR